mmetsp:Transcript_107872/g.186001  ORF Transcript_107872/g.186001 Transcript_107872/m.186001 type:complete len:291 (-) Transcript_107872:2234-3106(-)
MRSGQRCPVLLPAKIVAGGAAESGILRAKILPYKTCGAAITRHRLAVVATEGVRYPGRRCSAAEWLIAGHGRAGKPRQSLTGIAESTKLRSCGSCGLLELLLELRLELCALAWLQDGRRMCVADPVGPEKLRWPPFAVKKFHVLPQLFVSTPYHFIQIVSLLLQLGHLLPSSCGVTSSHQSSCVDLMYLLVYLLQTFHLEVVMPVLLFQPFGKPSVEGLMDPASLRLQVHVRVRNVVVESVLVQREDLGQAVGHLKLLETFRLDLLQLPQLVTTRSHHCQVYLFLPFQIP